MSLAVRYAHSHDAELIADLSRKTFYDTFALHNTPENMQLFLEGQFNKEKLMNEVEDKKNIFILAEYEGSVAGYAKLREGEAPNRTSDLPAIEIARIYALQTFIGKGVGNALMKKCIDIAYETGNRTIWLGVWEKNERAIQFYIKWGFEKIGEHDFVLGNDVQTDWLMKKNLQ